MEFLFTKAKWSGMTQVMVRNEFCARSAGKELPWFEKQLWLSMAYYHLVLPHHSLRQELPIPEPTRGTGSPRRWEPRTPAMAAGITDHVWTTAELLSYRAPAQFLDRFDEIEILFPSVDTVHQGN